MNNVNSSNQLSMPARVTLISEQSSERTPIQEFIHTVYAKQFAADIHQFMPLLMGLQSSTGSYQAALGLRLATDGPLFLEQYFDQAIEDRISEATDYSANEITRASIVEVGNLAAHHAGGTRMLIIALTAYLQGAGYDWVAFTSIVSLRNSFHKLGLKLYSLGHAELHRLPETEHKHWGRYYEKRPMVMLVNVHHTYGVLERLLRFEQALATLRHIWQQSFEFGHATQLHGQHLSTSS
jgi:hypothetical protein